MNKLHKDELFSIALHLKLPELLKFCSTSKTIMNLICNKNDIWNMKLSKEFPNYNVKLRRNTPKETYILLYKLQIVKDAFKTPLTLISLFNSTYLGLDYSSISHIPREIDVLVNLESLSLSSNNINSIPKELGNLKSLTRLYLDENRIKIIPKELGNLIYLEHLYLHDNQIEVIPKELGNLTQLTDLHLSDNEIRVVPKELSSLKKAIIYLRNNHIEDVPSAILNMNVRGLLNQRI